MTMLRICWRRRLPLLASSLLEVTVLFVDLLQYVRLVASRTLYTRGSTFLILIFKQPGAAENRSIISEIVSGFIDREGTSTFKQNVAIGIADMTPTASQEVPVSLP